jgi:hypothetical protein
LRSKERAKSTTERRFAKVCPGLPRPSVDPPGRTGLCYANLGEGGLPRGPGSLGPRCCYAPMLTPVGPAQGGQHRCVAANACPRA